MAQANETRTQAPLPDFIIIGAMKAGTTSLHEVLQRHPNIVMSQPKEPGFFSRDEIYARGEAWYRSLFAAAQPGQICGEASTCYSRWPHFADAPARIAEHVPNVKLLYIMRHPVSRAYSHYAHNMRFQTPISVEQAIEQDASIIDASLYMRQIERYQRYFPRERMCFLTLDDLNEQPTACISKCQRFLGVEEQDLVSDQSVQANASGQSDAYEMLTDRLYRVRRLPGVSTLVNLCPRRLRRQGLESCRKRLLRSFVGRRIAQQKKAQLDPLRPETRRMLLERFADDTRELERFLERPLSSWFE